MDQFISANGQLGKAILLDCRSLQPRFVTLDDPNVSFLITSTLNARSSALSFRPLSTDRGCFADSNVHHELVGGEYAARRQACIKAVEILQKLRRDIKFLR